MESQKKNTLKCRPNPGLKRMDQVRQVLRSHHYASRTEQTSGQWILRDIRHVGGKTHPSRLGAKEVECFLSYRATKGQVSASTQRQALHALVFPYREVLDRPLAAEITPIRRKRQCRKSPRAARETGWHWVFPARARALDPRSGRERRHHVRESGLQKAVKRAAAQAGLDKKVGCQTLRHRFATHVLEHGVHIRVLQDLLSHADVKTTEMDTHVMARDIRP